jgi:hypothetical protein
LKSTHPSEDLTSERVFNISTYSLAFAFSSGGSEDKRSSSSASSLTFGGVTLLPEGSENFKGRLQEGQVADLIVLDRDIFTVDPAEIKDIQVLRTMVDGEWVFVR